MEKGSASCLSLGALLLDQAVCGQVIEAIQPAAVRASMEAGEQFSRQGREKLEAQQLALEKARYEMNLAQRQYDAVDPENRLVASELEKRWNQAMAAAGELENQIEQARVDRWVLNEEDRRRLMDLGRDVKGLWDHPDASVELKKRILRTVLSDIIVADGDDPSRFLLHLHWQGGVHTELRVARNGSGRHRRVAQPEVADLVSELSKVCRDDAIAATLNRLGYHTGTGKTWRKHSVWSFRHTHRLPNYGNTNEWASIHQSAEILGVSDTVIHRLVRQGILPAKQVVESAPWIIARRDLALPSVVLQIQAVRQGRQLPTHSPNQQEFPIETATLQEV